MTIIENKTFDAERALYGSDGVSLKNCRFEGPADGESALKESRNIEVADSFFALRYPFWHDDNLTVDRCELTETCRAALWYSNGITVRNSKLHGIKALRECGDIRVENCDVVSPEFGWFNRDVVMADTRVTGEYFMLRSNRLAFTNVELNGKYSFQYVTDSVFENCTFRTKDALWHAKNVVVRNSVIEGEYLAWYAENITFDNCKIIGTQPLCYCRNLRLINCEMTACDLSFEKSEVEATLSAPIVSVKNPRSGFISAPAIGELIEVNEEACKITVG